MEEDPEAGEGEEEGCEADEEVDDAHEGEKEVAGMEGEDGLDEVVGGGVGQVDGGDVAGVGIDVEFGGVVDAVGADAQGDVGGRGCVGGDAEDLGVGEGGGDVGEDLVEGGFGEGWVVGREWELDGVAAVADVVLDVRADFAVEGEVDAGDDDEEEDGE